MYMDYSKVDDALPNPWPSGSNGLMSYSDYAAEALYIVELYPTSNRVGDGSAKNDLTPSDMATQRQSIEDSVMNALPAGSPNSLTNFQVEMIALPYQLKYDAWCRKYYGVDAAGHSNPPIAPDPSSNPAGTKLFAPDPNNPGFFNTTPPKAT